MNIISPIKKDCWMINEKLWIAVIYLFFSLFLLHLLLLYKMLFFFFFKLWKVVLYEKSQNTAMQNICCEQRTKKKCEQKNFFKIIIINTTILFFCLMPLRAIERKHFHFSFFLFTFFAPPDFFSSEIRGLWSIKCFSEMLPKLLIFMYKKTHIKVFLFFLIVQFIIFFLIMYALVYNDID